MSLFTRHRPSLGSDRSPSDQPDERDEQDERDERDDEPTVEIRLDGPVPTAPQAVPADVPGDVPGDERESAPESEFEVADGDGTSDEDGDRESDDPRDADEKGARLARRRFVRRQWRRRWLAWRRVVVGVLLVGLLAGAAWLVLLSSVLAVSSVQVEGTRLLSDASIRRAAQVPVGGPLATADLDAITARVERLPAVRSADVSRAWPDRIRVDVTERRAVAVVQSGAGGALRGTDPDGVVFRRFAKRPAGLPMIRMASGTGGDAVAEAAEVAGSLPAPLARQVAYVEVATVDRISLELRNGRTVRWGSAARSVDKARVLAVLLGQKASFYDVTVPGRPIIKR